MVEGSQRIVKITPDVYAFMLNYCRRGFTDVYADLRFVLSAGTHCPGIIIPLRHSRREEPKFRISFASWKILHQRHGTSRGSFRPRHIPNKRFHRCARRVPSLFPSFVSKNQCHARNVQQDESCKIACIIITRARNYEKMN